MHKKTVLITGATSGLGLQMTKLCLAKGYEVYATGRNEVSLTTLKNLGANAIRADLCHVSQIDELIQQLPVLDVAIINAGIGIFESVYALADEEIDTMIDVNVKAPIFLAKRLALKMQDGHFIFISSQAGKVATKKASVYAATKHAITGFIDGFRHEVAPYNIKVTGIFPGPIDTPFLQKADAAGTYRHAIAHFLLTPEQVANAVVKTIERPVRSVNLPRVMGFTSKLYALAPVLVEKFGGRFFNKK
ncbi:SDR family NAD(P)-dependent oxidoreductase [Metasolibacillus meyeri]|uniref:SDR family NAD(P)-dependent oxidoreductase n=1 Tax=Metasolibacillus meyeri TaxID=1071052 RepID=UPI000D30C589|nr:SDR family NAD(P)-dependent oxidoreductase [Metasolibacillus meyeri]